MKIARVIGTVVATQKDPKLIGSKLLIVQELDLDKETLIGSPVVAIDAVGAGIGEKVLVVSGSSARLTETTRNAPVDAAIVGIVDSVERGKSV
jgi:microcompartment protein CcmK/EutM